MVTGNGGSGKIRIQLDDLGVSRLGFVNDSSALPTAASRSQDMWYVVEEVSTMREARIEIKVSRLSAFCIKHLTFQGILYANSQTAIIPFMGHANTPRSSSHPLES